jgi:hypothetical protein
VDSPGAKRKVAFPAWLAKFIRGNLGHMASTKRAVTIPEIMLIAGTRVALGVGIGLLTSGWLKKNQKQAAGWALLGVGVFSTFPIVKGLLAKPPVE